MAKTKKRQCSDEEDPPVDTSDSEDEPIPKKAKTKSEKKKKSKAPAKVEEEIIADEEMWPYQDLMTLFDRMETKVPAKDKLKYESSADKLDWESIAFDNYTIEECKAMWQQVSNRLRRYRLLKELLTDAKEWAEHPWTNFYRSQKTNRHPDMPKRPLSTYMMFYMEKKGKVAAEYPTLEMTKLSTIIASMYKNLPEKQKQKYIDRAKSQRDEYMEKMEVFYKNHPELKPTKAKKQKAAKEYPGPRKPLTPFQHYLKEKMEKHKNEHESSKHKWNDHYKDAWKELSEKKKVNWIKFAMEDEERYSQELATYREEHPDYDGPIIRAILSKDEKVMYYKSLGKPEKPPNSGYSLFSRIMLSSEEIKHINHKDRMAQISSMWKNLSPKDKRKYHDKVQQMLEKYKLDFATYLESLPADKRAEELQSINVRRKADPANSKKKKPLEKAKVATKPESDSDEAPEIKKEVTEKSTGNYTGEGIELFKGEPEAPPSSPFKLFMKDFKTKHKSDGQRLKESSLAWQMLAENEKMKWRKKLHDLKARYIGKYENFLKSLTQEQLKEYSILKAKNNARRESMDSDKSDNEEEDDDEEEDEEGKDSSDSSDSSSSGEDSDSEDSSEDD